MPYSTAMVRKFGCDTNVSQTGVLSAKYQPAAPNPFGAGTFEKFGVDQRCGCCGWPIVGLHRRGEVVPYYRLTPAKTRSRLTVNLAHFACYQAGVREYDFQRWMATQCLRGFWRWGLSHNDYTALPIRLNLALVPGSTITRCGR